MSEQDRTLRFRIMNYSLVWVYSGQFSKYWSLEEYLPIGDNLLNITAYPHCSLRTRLGGIRNTQLPAAPRYTTEANQLTFACSLGTRRTQPICQTNHMVYLTSNTQLPANLSHTTEAISAYPRVFPLDSTHATNVSDQP